MNWFCSLVVDDTGIVVVTAAVRVEEVHAIGSSFLDVEVTIINRKT